MCIQDRTCFPDLIYTINAQTDSRISTFRLHRFYGFRDGLSGYSNACADANGCR